jgi:hypothetical protein
MRDCEKDATKPELQLPAAQVVSTATNYSPGWITLITAGSENERRAGWLRVIGYEVWMLGETLKMPQVVQAPLVIALSVQNAVTESRVLHARNLCDFCMPRTHPTDIKPENLFDDYSNSRYDTLRTLVEEVEGAYRKNDACAVVLPNGNTESHSPQWAFNKMLAHPTQDRGLGFNYQPFIDFVVPKIKLLADEIRRLEKERGRDFPSLE